MYNLQSAVKNKLDELVKCTKITEDLCNSLKTNDIVTKEEEDSLSYYRRHSFHIKGATYLYDSVISKLSKSKEDLFVEGLRKGKNTEAYNILRPRSPRKEEESDNISIALHHFVDSELKLLTDFESGIFSTKGKFEGHNLADEETANELLSGRGEKGWHLFEGKEVVIKSGISTEFIQRVKGSTKCLEEKTLWWNPQAVLLPPNFIPRKVRRLASSME